MGRNRIKSLTIWSLLFGYAKSQNTCGVSDIDPTADLSLRIQQEYSNVHINITQSLYDGELAVPGSLPWAVTVQACTENGDGKNKNCNECGGTLLDGGEYVITAADCVSDGIIRVMVNGERQNVRRVINHGAANVALLKLKDSLDSNALCFPPKGFCVDNKPETCVVVSANGQTQTLIEPLSDRTCHSRYELNIDPLFESCAKSGTYEFMNGCEFDSGSAIMCRYPQDSVWVFYGVVTNVKECGKPSASTFIKYEAVANWIEKFVGAENVDSGLSALGDTQTCQQGRDSGIDNLDNMEYWQSEGVCGRSVVEPNDNLQSSRIIGGQEAKSHSWPWQTYIVSCMAEGCMTCGGTLISPYWVLTAGHCVPTGYGAHGYVLLGAHKISDMREYKDSIDIREFVLHPQYYRRILRNDIALARLAKPAPMGDMTKVRPACIAQPNICLDEGQNCIAVGWGVTAESSSEASDTLMEVTVPLIARENCIKLPRPYNLVSPGAICAGYKDGGKDACTGDSGGPLLCQLNENSPWIVYGVTSWGYGCGRAEKPGVYTRVNLYTTWLQQVTGITPRVSDNEYPLNSCDATKREWARTSTEAPTTTTTTTAPMFDGPGGSDRAELFSLLDENSSEEKPAEDITIIDSQQLGICGNPQIDHNPSLFVDLPNFRKRRNAFGGFAGLFGAQAQTSPISSSSGNQNGSKSKNSSKNQTPNNNPFGINLQQRIIGGNEANPHSWPWAAQIITGKGGAGNTCGATLIHQNWIITAAHCIPKFSVEYKDETGATQRSKQLTIETIIKRYGDVLGDIQQRTNLFNMTVFLGVHDMNNLDGAVKRRVSKIITHPEFNRPYDYSNDIALLQLDSPVEFNEKLSPLCIPDEDVCFKEGVPCVTTGWGLMDFYDVTSISSTLQEVAVRVIGNEKCKTYPDYSDKLQDTMICAGYKDGGRDACAGDSGGSLICKPNADGPWTFYGITSWGIGCAKPEAPGVYARVPLYANWIREQTGIGSSINTGDFPSLSCSSGGGGWMDGNYKPENSITFDQTTARQEQQCDKQATTPAVITSENHPSSYERNSDCRYCVKSKAAGNYVSLEIDALKLDSRRNCYPGKDYLIIENLDGSPISSPICTIIRKNPIRAMAQNALCVKFVTNNRVERSGFSANFKEIDEFQSACGGKAAVIADFNSEYPKRLSALSHISSAGFPGRVPPGSECSWHITAPANDQIVHLEFISFKMAKNCKFHFVQLYSAPDCKPENLNKSNEIATLCGAKRAKQRWNYFSKGSGMCVVMVTDKSTVSAGFKANYQAVSSEVSKNIGGKKKGRSQIQLITSGQALPPSIGEKFWVIGG